MRSPVIWFGGKGRSARWILSHLPPHRIYVEAFGGGASLLFAKPPSPVEVYNDIDEGLVNFFRVLRDPERFARFQRLAALTPYSRAEHRLCRETWQDQNDPVERAYRGFVTARMGFSGRFTSDSWGFAVTASNRGMAETISRWLGSVEMLPAVAGRLLRVQVECQDWRDCLRTYDTPDTLFYLDPPYPAETRRSGRYPHEMTDADHDDLLASVLEIEGKAMLSSYPNARYRSVLGSAGWERRTRDVACYAAGKTRGTGLLGKGATQETQRRTEVLWISPNAVVQPGLF